MHLNPSSANKISISHDNLVALLSEAFAAGSTSPYDCMEQEVERLFISAKDSYRHPQSEVKKYIQSADTSNKRARKLEYDRIEGILSKANTIDDLADITCPMCNKAEMIEHRSGNSSGMIFTTLLCPRCGWGPNMSFQEMLRARKA